MAIQPVILAAGKGSRLKVGGYKGPKALYPLLGRPSIDWVLSAFDPLQFAEPISVIRHQGGKVRKHLGKSRQCVRQPNLDGTAKAVEVVVPQLKDEDLVVVVNVDQVCITFQSLEKVVGAFKENSVAMAFATVTVPNLRGWRSTLRGYGQVIRNTRGRIVAIVEGGVRGANTKNFEFNAGIYCFNALWLKKEIPNVPKDSVTGEYYLTYLVQLAVEENSVVAVPVPPEEAVAVNTPRDGRNAEFLLERHIQRMHKEIRTFVLQERKRLGLKELSDSPVFEGSCIAFGEFQNLLIQLIHTREGCGHWIVLEDPSLLQGVYREVCRRLQ